MVVMKFDILSTGSNGRIFPSMSWQYPFFTAGGPIVGGPSTIKKWKNSKTKQNGYILSNKILEMQPQGGEEKFAF
jgi:hypothetical protein